MPVFEWRSVMPVPVEELFAYHVRPGAFERLAPPWQRLRVLEQSGGMREGGRLVVEASRGPLKRRWEAELRGYIEGRQFVDRQAKGPFAAWEHVHRFLPRDERSSELLDHVEYSLPAGSVSDAIAARLAGKQLGRLFRFRHARTRMDLERHAAWAGEPPLRVLISGASGLVGSSLAHYLTTAGHEVVKLVRRPAAGPGEVSWDPAAGRLDPAGLRGVDAVVNLAGASIASLWTPGRRKAILESRLQATGTLVDALRRMETPPRVLVSASAVGAYGSRGGEALTEESSLGEDFLAEVCRAWEAAAARAAEVGVRVVTPRFGIVMSSAGGALAKMLPAFRAGLGTRLGDGEQWWSWVDLDDLLGAVEWMLHDGELSGVVNVTSPEPVSNRDFTRILGHVLHRPAALAVPRVAVARGLGGMGREMFLASQRAVPTRLGRQGFRPCFPELEAALRYELGKE
ncbi:MAG: TIGR01777 family oxidoreductase [Thermoleophilia bacterium]